MVIAVDKFTAVKMYDKVNYYWKEGIKNLNSEISATGDVSKRAELKDLRDYMTSVQMAVVISEEDKEEEKFNKEGLSVIAHRQRMAVVDENGFDIEDNFKDPDHPLSLVFVCAMWLTGFDAPSVSTLYLDKPMKSHTLMQTIARANRVFPGKENGIIVDFLDVFKYLKRALADYATGTDGLMPVKDLDKLLDQLNEAIQLTLAFCLDKGIDLNNVVTDTNTFKRLDYFGDYANIIVGNDETRNEYKVLSNAVESLYESLRPDIFKMNFDPRFKEAILYLSGIVEGKIRPEVLEVAKGRINKLLDQSVLIAEGAKEFIINEEGKEIDLSKIDLDELRAKMKKMRNKNLEIAELREMIEKKLEQMLKKNITRSDFAERFKTIIDSYNAGGSKNDDFYEKVLKFMEELREEEERHIKEDLSEEELEIYDLLCKDKLTKAEEQRVKLAAKQLYETLTAQKDELFIKGWHEDAQPKEKVRAAIWKCLGDALPESYDREIFAAKSTKVYQHIVDQAMMGLAWAA
jgi:type I restriction enzyme R subunit